MPTRRPRHSITETPPVQEALDALRQRGIKVELADLVVRGAQHRISELEADRREHARTASLRRELVEQLRTGDGIDVASLHEVREIGWTHQ